MIIRLKFTISAFFLYFFFEQVDTLEKPGKNLLTLLLSLSYREWEFFGSNKWVLIMTTPCFRSQNMCIYGHKSRKLLFCKSLKNTNISPIWVFVEGKSAFKSTGLKGVIYNYYSSFQWFIVKWTINHNQASFSTDPTAACVELVKQQN